MAGWSWIKNTQAVFSGDFAAKCSTTNPRLGFGRPRPAHLSLKIGEHWDHTGQRRGWLVRCSPTTALEFRAAAEETDSAWRTRPDRGGQPFTPDAAPIELKRARGVAVWKQEANGMVGELPTSPVKRLR